MPNPEWGVKRVCPSCSARFYDLNTDPATCPVCGGVFSLESLTLKRAARDRSESKSAASAAKANTSEDADDLDEDVLDDDSDIAVDDDDVLDDDDDDDTVSIEEIGERSNSDDDEET